MTAATLITYLSAIDPTTEVGFFTIQQGFTPIGGIQESNGRLQLITRPYGMDDTAIFPSNVAAVWKLQQNKHNHEQE